MKITIDDEVIEIAVTEYMERKGFRVQKVTLETSYSTAKAEIDIDTGPPETTSRTTGDEDEEAE